MLWIVFFFIISVFYLFVLLKFFELKEFIWKLNYICLFLLLHFSLFFMNADKILYILNLSYTEIFVLKDPQEYINLLVSTSIFFTILISLFILPLFFFTFLKNIMSKKANWIFFYFISYYYYILFYTLNILHYDLATSSWDIFSSTNQYYFDFQPKLEYIYYSFCEEFLDLFVFNIFFYFFVFFTFSGSIFFYTNRNIKVFLIFLFYLFMLFFFGGDSFYIDLLIFILSSLCIELYTLIVIFLFQLKKFSY